MANRYRGMTECDIWEVCWERSPWQPCEDGQQLLRLEAELYFRRNEPVNGEGSQSQTEVA